MKKVVLIAVVAALALLVDVQMASAGKCGGGRRGGRSRGSCYSCGSCYSGCATCGGGGCATCAGGVCAVTPTGHAMASREATIVVNLPADARLTIDDEPTTSTTANRVFQTPALPDSSKEYHYTLKAEVVRDGKVKTTTQQVTVRAGQVTQVELKVSAETTAAQ